MTHSLVFPPLLGGFSASPRASLICTPTFLGSLQNNHTPPSNKSTDTPKKEKERGRKIHRRLGNEGRSGTKKRKRNAHVMNPPQREEGSAAVRSAVAPRIVESSPGCSMREPDFPAEGGDRGDGTRLPTRAKRERGVPPAPNSGRRLVHIYARLSFGLREFSAKSIRSSGVSLRVVSLSPRRRGRSGFGSRRRGLTRRGGLDGRYGARLCRPGRGPRPPCCCCCRANEKLVGAEHRPR